VSAVIAVSRTLEIVRISGASLLVDGAWSVSGCEHAPRLLGAPQLQPLSCRGWG
jgi:hypothetical protein